MIVVIKKHINSSMRCLFKILVIFLFTTKTFAATEQIGVIGFVIGDVFNQNGKQLNVGDSIFFGDTISSNEGAKSQLMFIDQTVMTIGSKTELTIDEFIFDPAENTGKLLTTIKAGSVKILTGKISEINPENLEVKTPAGTIGTRGTEFKASVDPETTQSKILLVGPGPNNQLNLRPGSVEVSNALGTVTLDQPYLYTELTQNLAPTDAAIISQVELQKFQELEVEPQAPGSTEVLDEESETLLVEGEEEAPEGLELLSEEEIQDIVKGEMFAEGEDEGSLVMDTLVAALAKDDGGITAQILGKSFMTSGDTRRVSASDLPEGMELNSPEALIFMEDKEMLELEKVMLVSARVKDVEYVPSKFNQFSGLDDIRVPILNDKTGEVVFLEMGSIDFKPQVIPAGFDPDAGPSFMPRMPEQIFLKRKGDDNNVFINFDEGQFFEEVIDPQMEALDVKYMDAMEAGASQEEMEAIFTEMDKVMQKVDETMVAIDMGRMQTEFMPVGIRLDIFSKEEFSKEQDAFLFDANQYSESWDEAENGKVAIFQMDGSVDFVDEKEAFAAREAVDKAYEEDFSEAFPEIFRAEKKAESLMIQADKQKTLLYAQVNQLVEAGGSSDEVNVLFKKMDGLMATAYSEVDAAFQEVMLIEMKTDVLMVAEEAASLKSEIAEAKKTGMINGMKVSKEEISDVEKEAASLDMEVQAGRADFAEEVMFASKAMPEVKMATPTFLTFEMQMMEMEMEPPKMEMMEMESAKMQMMEMEMAAMEKYYEEPKYYDPGYQQDQFVIGTTSYSDLHQVSSGTDTYKGRTTDLLIVTAGVGADNSVKDAGQVAGNFKATTTIDYSNRTVTQGAEITVNKLGKNTTSRSFNVETGHDYSMQLSGEAKPIATYNVSGDDNSNAVESGGATSLTGAVSTLATDGTTYVEQSTVANTHYLVTVSSEIQNTSAQVAAGTVQTTVIVESEEAASGSNISNKASGTDTPANKN
jgi:hypothetical protein